MRVKPDKTGPAGPAAPQNVTVHGGDFVGRDKFADHLGDVDHRWAAPGGASDHRAEEDR